MGEQLPILKGILKGNFSYHNARKFDSYLKIRIERNWIFVVSDNLKQFNFFVS